MGSQEQQTWDFHQRVVAMREGNRNRPGSLGNQASQSHSARYIQRNESQTNGCRDPRGETDRGADRPGGMQTHGGRSTNNSENGSRFQWAHYIPAESSRPSSIGANQNGFNPLPSRGFPNIAADSCPAFTSDTYQNWRMGSKLRIAGQHGATSTQLLAKLIYLRPIEVKTEALLYPDQTESIPQSRPIESILAQKDGRYGQTDSERSCARLAQFAEFKRESDGNYKD